MAIKRNLKERCTEYRTIDSPYRYRISSRGAGSDKFGPCEVCGKSVDTTYLQVEAMIVPPDGDEPGYMTHFECHDLFGHQECLIGERR